MNGVLLVEGDHLYVTQHVNQVSTVWKLLGEDEHTVRSSQHDWDMNNGIVCDFSCTSAIKFRLNIGFPAIGESTTEHFDEEFAIIGNSNVLGDSFCDYK